MLFSNWNCAKLHIIHPMLQYACWMYIWDYKLECCKNNSHNRPYVAIYWLGVYWGCPIWIVRQMHIIPLIWQQMCWIYIWGVQLDLCKKTHIISAYIAKCLVDVHIVFQIENVRKIHIITYILQCAYRIYIWDYQLDFCKKNAHNIFYVAMYVLGVYLGCPIWIV